LIYVLSAARIEAMSSRDFVLSFKSDKA
jgi:hypothetical protein